MICSNPFVFPMQFDPTDAGTHMRVSLDFTVSMRLGFMDFSIRPSAPIFLKLREYSIYKPLDLRQRTVLGCILYAHFAIVLTTLLPCEKIIFE